MPLSVGTGLHVPPIASQAWQQIVNVLTGKMSDQPITIANSITARSTSPSSAFSKAFQFGSSGPFIAFGSSTPTAACVPGSLFLNASGSSTTCLYLGISNSGGASSSNWDTLTLT